MDLEQQDLQTSGVVTNIQRFCLNDGPGIRTTVFLKGCPLHCPWCHNPESLSASPEIMLDVRKCIGCNKCLSVCPNHQAVENEHVINRKHCIGCGKCAAECPSGALSLVGRKMAVDEILKVVLKDRVFYGAEGGMTLSGGEPLFQPDMALALLRQAKRQGLHTCVETSGLCTWDVLEAAASVTDVFLFDYKMTDPQKHSMWISGDRQLILDNLQRLNEMHVRIHLRCPVIPGYNDDENHLDTIAALANICDSVLRVEVEPYHPLGKEKATQVGRKYALKNLSFVPETTVKEWIEYIAARTQKPVIQG